MQPSEYRQERCPHGWVDVKQCEPCATAAERDQLLSEIASLKQDAARLDWLRDNMFDQKWNGVVGEGCEVQWRVWQDFRFTSRELTDESGIRAGDFRRAIDAEMAAAAT